MGRMNTVMQRYDLHLMNGEVLPAFECLSEDHKTIPQEFAEAGMNTLFVVMTEEGGFNYIPKHSVAYISMGKQTGKEADKNDGIPQ